MTPSNPVIIPHAALAAPTLRRLIESVVLREGTDYGVREYSLQEKVSEVVQQLKLGRLRIVFDSRTHTVNLISTDTAV